MASNWSYLSESYFFNPKEELGVSPIWSVPGKLPHTVSKEWDWKCKIQSRLLLVYHSFWANWTLAKLKQIDFFPLSFWPWFSPVIEKSVQPLFHNTQQISDWMPPGMEFLHYAMVQSDKQMTGCKGGGQQVHYLGGLGAGPGRIRGVLLGRED